MELCLGTVQFGMRYGIAGQKQPSETDSIAMLDYATQNQVKYIDTANAYGTAEEIIGRFIRKKTIGRDNIFIISKSKPNILDDVPEEKYYDILKDNLLLSLKNIGVDYLDSYLLHSTRYVYNEAILTALGQLAEDGYIKQYGVSVYEVKEADYALMNKKIKHIQLPYSVFDQRMRTEGFLGRAYGSGVLIHSRSAFLQGLILMDEEQIPDYLSKAKPIVKKIKEISARYNITRTELAIGVVRAEKSINHLVFGVDNILQLKENIELFHKEKFDRDMVEDVLGEFQNICTDIVMPSLWGKSK